METNLRTIRGKKKIEKIKLKLFFFCLSLKFKKVIAKIHCVFLGLKNVFKQLYANFVFCHALFDVTFVIHTFTTT